MYAYFLCFNPHSQQKLSFVSTPTIVTKLNFLAIVKFVSAEFNEEAQHMSSELIQKIASDAVIDTAYEWLCKRRRGYSHNDEVWDIRFRWAEFKHRNFKVFDTVVWHGQTRLSVKKRCNVFCWFRPRSRRIYLRYDL